MKKNIKSFYTPEYSISCSFSTDEISFDKEKTDTYTVKMSKSHNFSNPEEFKEMLPDKVDKYFKRDWFEIFTNSEKNSYDYNNLICKDFSKKFFNNIKTYTNANHEKYFSVYGCNGIELSHFLFSNPELIKKFHCEYFNMSTTLFFEKHRVDEKYKNCNAWDKIKITYDLITQKTQIEIMVCTNKNFLNNKELFYTTGILKEDNKFEITKIESLSTEYVVQDAVPVEYKRFDRGSSPSYFSVDHKEIFNNKETYSDFKKIKGFNEKEVLNKFEKILNNNTLAVKEAIEENKATVKEFAEKFYGDYFENKEKIENETNSSEKELDAQEQNEYDYDYYDDNDDCEY